MDGCWGGAGIGGVPGPYRLWKMEEPKAASGPDGHVHVVTHANWNPFEYMKDGKITAGFDVELITEAAKSGAYGEYFRRRMGSDF